MNGEENDTAPQARFERLDKEALMRAEAKYDARLSEQARAKEAEEFERSEAERLKFMAKSGFFTPSGGTLEGPGYKFFFALMGLLFSFGLWVAAFGGAVYNFGLIAVSDSTGWNWVFALACCFYLWVNRVVVRV